jgi:dipeptidyl aminopeptidase/acylaminoacyl peptidase
MSPEIEEGILKMKDPAIEHFMNSESISRRAPFRLTPDGKHLVITLGSRSRAMRHDAAVCEEMGGCRILVINTKTRQVLDPFPDWRNSCGASWSRDGDSLAAYLWNPESSALGLWRPSSGEIRLFDLCGRCLVGFDTVQWTPDGNHLVVTCIPHLSPCIPEAAGADADPDVEVLRARRIFPDGEGVSGGEWPPRPRAALAVLDIRTGVAKQLTKGWWPTVVRISPDGSRAACFRQTPGQVDVLELVVVPLDGKPQQTLAENFGPSYRISFSWSPSGRQICYSRSRSNLFITEVDSPGQPTELHAVGFTLGQYEAPLWSPDGSYILAVGGDSLWKFATDGSTGQKLVGPPDFRVLFCAHYPDTCLALPEGHTHIVAGVSRPENTGDSLAWIDVTNGKIDKTAEIAGQHFKALGFYFHAMDSARNTLCFARQSQDETLEICAVSEKDKTPRLLYIPGSSARGLAVRPNSRIISYQDAKGNPLQMRLYLPATYAEGNTLPVILDVYPGSCEGGTLEPGFRAILCEKGFAVATPSTTIPPRKAGVWISDPSALPQFQENLCGSLSAAVETLVTLGIADPARIGVFGHSAGGSCVIRLLTRLEIFRAAIASAPAGVSPIMWWMDTYCQLGNTIRDEERDDPWRQLKTELDESPFFALDKIETPLLLICGMEDEFCRRQTEDICRVLAWLGKPVELRKYHGCDHWWGAWPAAEARDFYERVIEWFQKGLSANA